MEPQCRHQEWLRCSSRDEARMVEHADRRRRAAERARCPLWEAPKPGGGSRIAACARPGTVDLVSRGGARGAGTRQRIVGPCWLRLSRTTQDEIHYSHTICIPIYWLPTPSSFTRDAALSSFLPSSSLSLPMQFSLTVFSLILFLFASSSSQSSFCIRDYYYTAFEHFFFVLILTFYFSTSSSSSSSCSCLVPISFEQSKRPASTLVYVTTRTRDDEN